MSLSSLVDSKFYRTLLEEEGGNVKELLDAEEYLVPQPGFFENQANGLTRHHSHRVRTLRVFRTATRTGLRSAFMAFVSHCSCTARTKRYLLNQSEHRSGTGGGRRAEWAEHALVGQHAGAESVPDTSGRSHGQRELSVPPAGPKPIPLFRWRPVGLGVSGRGQGRASLQSWTLQ